jgi:hypothetical protein
MTAGEDGDGEKLYVSPGGDAALRREVQYGKEALALVKGLRDRVTRNVDDIDALIELIRHQMAEMGETDG